jgi:hypothetical protein
MIKPASDRKTQAYPSQLNTFGTLPGDPRKGGTCPGATTAAGGCQEIKKGRKLPTCYVEKLMSAYKGVRTSLQHNTDLLLNANYDEKITLFLNEFLRFYDTEIKRNKVDQYLYRIHWSGDIPDEEYAQALKQAIIQMPHVGFWGYTRSMFSIPILASIPNLTWYISVDDVNKEQAMATYMEYKHHSNIEIAYMAKEKPVLEETRLIACPVDTGKKELNMACQNCMLCMAGKPIWFKTR